MKRFLVLGLIVVLGLFASGCGNKTNTTGKKTEVKTSQSKDGEITGGTTKTTETTTETKK